jgi:hypothetical protein
MEVFDTLKITFDEPVLPFDFDQLCFQQKVDTLWEDLHIPIVQDSLNPRLFYFQYTWPYKQEYRLRIDSAAIHSIYGLCNDSLDVVIKTRAEEEYGHLYLQISGIEGPAFGQLLDSKDAAVKQAPLVEGEISLEDIKPGTYYLRLIKDTNDNGRWDPGDYAQQLQAEEVYYYPNALEIKGYMEWEQSWNVTETPLLKQKPLAITKNKPKEKTPKRNAQQERQQQERQQNNSNRNGNSNNGRQTTLQRQ